jgi:uncharacterized protein YpbB
MDQLVYEILWKLEDVKRIKKVKAYYEELISLEELQVKAVLRLMQAKLLIETVVKGEVISKEKLSSEEIRNYKIRKVAVIQEEYKKANVTLIDDQADLERYSKKKKTDKEPKKQTAQVTYEMWKENNSIEEIALLRKYTVGTIYGHFTKLIQDKTVKVEDILPQDKLEELKKVFTGYTDESLGALKEQVGEAFSWEELRMFKESL